MARAGSVGVETGSSRENGRAVMGSSVAVPPEGYNQRAIASNSGMRQSGPSKGRIVQSSDREGVHVVDGAIESDRPRMRWKMANPKLSEGDTVPAFEAESTSGETVSDQSLRGSKYVLYFYPKDDTPGCTTEACDFRDNMARLEGVGYQVLGVSPDSMKRHENFRARYELNFPLLSDPDKSLAETFGVFREKKNYGKTYMGIVRSTFVVSDDGTLTHVFDNVRAKGHVDRVLRELVE